MPYLGRTPTAVPVTADDIPANSIDASKIADGTVDYADIARLTGDFTLGDGKKIKLGASDDLQIFHDGGDSYVKDAGEGRLVIETNGSDVSLKAGVDNMLVATKDGAVDIRYAGSVKLATTNTGIDITGSVTCDGLTSTGIDDNATSTAITIDSSENVGIGTTSPSSKLEVYGGGISDIPLVIDHAWGSSSTALLTASAGGTEVLKVQRDGRGLSQFTAKAWVNFNGTGTVAIRDSHNVSSITDMATGEYRVTLSNDMASTNFCASVTGVRYYYNPYDTWDANSRVMGGVDDVNKVHITCQQGGQSAWSNRIDHENVYCLVFGD